ncbi:serine hydrolase [Catellatospora methionotrophica]|uniref:Serine hydrolase n=1 Tax=Catellatospora methionotrophica TaxID=121620 RepID=A0A8J3PC87_9ACTN|nr:serine hydrolase domain-containing protein [Catellatospora methionotrophica]GIG11747.1 serine hydrolase [Catellatospora methionotrophica]
MSDALSPSGMHRLHEAMAARVGRGELPGLVTLLARDDQVQVDVIGTHDVDGATPMSRDTLFRAGSLTKPMLAAVTMMLVDDGVLDLAEPVDRLLPELAGRRVLARLDGPIEQTVPVRRPVTVEDLLTFRMGFGVITEPEYNPPYPIVQASQELRLVLAAPDPRTPYPPDEWIKIFATLPLMYQPGERWQYNAGSLVLGVLVARAAGRPLGEVLHARLFAPLAMADTGFWTAAANAARLPGHYHTGEDGGGLRQHTATPAADWTRPPAFPSGAGGLLTSADDLLAFARLLLAGGVSGGRRLLSAESVARMTTNRLTPQQIATAGMLLGGQGWGYGMAVAVAPDEVSATPGRYGWDGGYGTTWYTDPDRGLIAIALSQTSDFLFNGARDEFLRLAFTSAD